jgi:branched-chain amino acid transport system substrate-binding protein
MATAAGVKGGLWITSSDIPFFAQTPVLQAMNAVVDKYYPGLRQVPNFWTENASTARVSGLLLAYAVKAGGLTAKATPTSGEVLQGLHSLHGDTLEGTAPPLTFAPGSRYGCLRRAKRRRLPPRSRL